MVNQEILRERSALTCGLGAFLLEKEGVLQIARLAVKYRVPGRDEMTRGALFSFESRIAMIPVDLVLAQAANESAWGTSRCSRAEQLLWPVVFYGG